MIEIVKPFFISFWQMFSALLNPIFLIPIVILIIIYILIYIKKVKEYKAGAYYQITRVPFLSIRRDLGRYGEYLTYKRLKCFENDGAKFLFNVYIPKNNGETTEIDVLMISKKGIFVFESKNYSGWIFGSENQKNWYQTLPAGRGRSHKEHFYNPIMQNRSHIKHLKALIGEQVPMYSIIVFSERCTLKKITIKSNDINVINRNQVSFVVTNILKRTSENIITDVDIANLYKQLYPYTQVSEAEKAQHIVNIQNKLTEKQISVSNEIKTKVKNEVEETNLLDPTLSTPVSDETNVVQKDVVSEPQKIQLDNDKPLYSNMDVSPTNMCPRCGGKLVLRIAAKGANAGNQFWGCANFPKCRYIKSVEQTDDMTS